MLERKKERVQRKSEGEWEEEHVFKAGVRAYICSVFGGKKLQMLMLLQSDT